MIISSLVGFAILADLDQWIKGLAIRSLKGQKPFVVWNGVLEFYYSENRGAVFGMMQERQFFSFLTAVLVLGVVAYPIWKMPPEGRYRPLAICLTTVGTGAVGNMISCVSQGYVVDFLYFKLIDFPIFNVADCHITAGAACLVFLIMFYYKGEDMACFSFKKH